MEKSQETMGNSDKSKSNGTKSGDSDQDTLVDLVSIIKARIAALVEKRKNLMAELVPVDAAIYELEQLLAEYGGYGKNPSDVEAWVQPPKTMEPTNWVGTSPVEPKTPQKVVRTPVNAVKRPGPAENPLPANTSGGVGVETRGYVQAPGGAVVPTNAELLKQQLGMR